MRKPERTNLFLSLIILLAARPLLPAQAQVSFRPLQPNEKMPGLSLSFNNAGPVLSGTLEHAPPADKSSILTIFGLTSLIASASIGSLDPDERFASRFRIAIGRKAKPQKTQIGYFAYLGFDVRWGRTYRLTEPKPFIRRLVISNTVLGPNVTMGVFKPVELAPEFLANFFFGLSYHGWRPTDREVDWLYYRAEGVPLPTLTIRDLTLAPSFNGWRLYDDNFTLTENGASAFTGVELDLSPRFSVYLSFRAFFCEPDRFATIGINF